MATLTIIPLASGEATVYNKWDTAVTITGNHKTGGQSAKSVDRLQDTVMYFTEGVAVTVTESTDNSTFKGWANFTRPLVKNVACTLAPFDLEQFQTNATTAPDNFFRNFNNNGSLTSLPEGSFDTSNITNVKNSFFSNFNNNGLLTSLPIGSFNTSNITEAGSSFFYNFNRNGSLTYLPRSFKLPQSISSCPESFCQSAFSGISKGTKPLYFHCASTDTFSAGDEYPTPRSPSAGTTVYVAEDIEPPKFLERNQLGHLWGKVKEKDNETLNRSKVHAESYTGRKIEDSLIPIKERIEELELPDPVAFSLNQNGGVVATFTKEGE